MYCRKLLVWGEMNFVWEFLYFAVYFSSKELGNKSSKQFVENFDTRVEPNATKTVTLSSG